MKKSSNPSRDLNVKKDDVLKHSAKQLKLYNLTSLTQLLYTVADYNFGNKYLTCGNKTMWSRYEGIGAICLDAFSAPSVQL